MELRVHYLDLLIWRVFAKLFDPFGLSSNSTCYATMA